MSLAAYASRGVLVLGSVLVAGACGPVEGPFGTIGGPWKFECGDALDAGESCPSDGMCASGLYCKGDSGGNPGTCASRLAAGATCESTFDCASGLVCKMTTLDGPCYLQNCDANGVCQQGAASGAKCNPPALDCPTNQLCVMGPSVGQCVAAPGLGEACNDLVCSAGLVCQRITIQCVAPPAEGEYCGVTPGAAPCAPGLVCRTNSTNLDLDGRCGKPVAIGGACGSGGECVPGAHCNLSKLVCEKNQTAGESCKNGNECGEFPFDAKNGLDCVRGECVDTTVAGAECWPGPDHRCKQPLTCVPKD
jgi:hypothetical protein